MKHRFLPLIFWIQILTFALSLCASEPQIKGKTAPAFRLANLNGYGKGMVSLAEYFSPDSNQAVIVSFFATWCAPCRQELPFLQKMADSLSVEGLRMVAVCVDTVYGEKQSDMVKALRLTCPVVHDKFGIVVRRFECPKALPYTVYIDRSGVVKAAESGFSEEKKEMIGKIVAKCLEGN